MVAQLIRSPFFFRRLLVIVLSAIAIIVIAGVFIDQPLAKFSGDPANIQFWLFHREITEIGKSEGYFAFAILLWITATLLGKRSSVSAQGKKDLLKWRNWGRAFFISLLTCGLAIHTIKPLIGRLRPHKSPDFFPTTFNGFNMDWDWQSFPSGHSQTLFTAATMLALMFPRAAIWIFLTAFYLSMTRAFTVAHFTSDVIGGAVLGFVVTVLTLYVLDRRQWLNLDDFKSKTGA